MTEAFDPIIGRQLELERLDTLLATERLVTITGLGGVGKTRLARAAVERTTGLDRTVIVDAGHLPDVDSLVGAIASSFGLRGQTTQAAGEALALALDGTASLVLLDELERLDGAGPAIAELLQRAHGLRVLATSRVALGVSGEAVFPLAGLALPTKRDAAGVATSPAVGLLLARARGLGANLGVDEQNATALAGLVERLDGLPLAIELAAIRTRVLTPQEIDRRIADHGLAALEASGHPPLVAAIDWSLGWLSEPESVALRAMALSAGCDLDLLAAMLPGDDVATGVAGLIAAGLVLETDGGPITRRFDVLEAVRDVVRRRMPPATAGALLDVHARAILERVRGLDRRSATEPAEATASLDRDADNVRQALARLTEVDPTAGYELLAAAVRLWRSGFRSSEAARAYERLVARSPEDSYARSRALNLYSTIIWETDGTDVARQATIDSIALARRVGDHQSVVHGLAGMLALQMGDPDMAEVARLRTELEQAAAVDDPAPAFLASLFDARWALVAIETGAGSDETLRLAVEAAAVANGVAPVREMTALANVALAHLLRGSAEQAVEPARRAARLASDLRHDTEAGFQATLVEVLVYAGHLDEARAVLIATIDQVSGHRPWDVEFVGVLRAATAVLANDGWPDQAARVAGAFFAIADPRLDLPLADDRRLIERSIAVARHEIGSVALRAGMRNGATTDPRRLLVAVQGDLSSPTPGSGRPRPAQRLRHGQLTAREVEVLGLIGQGRTDAEIAETLAISPKTASVHVANIKGKLGLGNRLEVALRARELGVD